MNLLVINVHQPSNKEKEKEQKRGKKEKETKKKQTKKNEKEPFGVEEVVLGFLEHDGPLLIVALGNGVDLRHQDHQNFLQQKRNKIGIEENQRDKEIKAKSEQGRK